MPTMRILELHELHRQLSTHLAGLGEQHSHGQTSVCPGKQIPDSLCNNYLQMRDTENVGIETESSGSALSAVQLTV